MLGKVDPLGTGAPVQCLKFIPRPFEQLSGFLVTPFKYYNRQTGDKTRKCDLAKGFLQESSMRRTRNFLSKPESVVLLNPLSPKSFWFRHDATRNLLFCQGIFKVCFCDDKKSGEDVCVLINLSTRDVQIICVSCQIPTF